MARTPSATPAVASTVTDASGLVLFRLRGVPIVLAPTWWIGSLVVVVLYTPMVWRILPDIGVPGAAMLAAAFAVLLGVSVLLHELGHCVVALRLGLGVRRLRLFLLGGLTEVVRTPRRPGQEGLVAAAGPIVSFVLAAVFGALLLVVPGGGAAWLLVAECAVANLAVAVFNVLPGLPLDGGRVLRAAIWAVTGKRALGTKIAVFGAGAVAFGLVVWAVFGLAEGSTDRWLRLGVCVLTAWFVVIGARDELSADARKDWPSGLTLAELVRPVLQLPAESPVADALAASAGRGVVLVRADGFAAGLLDEGRAQRLASSSPLAPAAQAAEPIGAENVVLDGDDGEEIIDRVRTTAAWQFLVVDDEGRPSGVLRREDLRAALNARRAR